MVSRNDMQLEYTHSVFKFIGLFSVQKSDTIHWTEYYIDCMGISFTTYKGKRVNKWCSIKL